jgi:hypothetical protein
VSAFNPSVWREVQEALYQRFRTGWIVDPGADPIVYRTPFVFEDEKIDPPAGMWVRFSVKRMPGGQGTLGGPGRRKMDRVGMIFGQLFKPPGDGVGDISDAGDYLAKLFENCRIQNTHDIRFAEVEPGQSGQVENGRWLGLSVEGRFDYEEHN